MQTKRILAATAVALFAASPAFAFGGGSGSVSKSGSFEIGAAGSSLTKGGVDGGSYAKGKGGSDAFGFSKNHVTNTGTASVGLGSSTDTRTATGWGLSVAKTTGPGAVAEAYEERSTFGKSKTSFNVGLSKSYDFNYSWGSIGW
jgi:hypothetical protein